MNERARNVAVGLTVIAALILLGVMIVIFAGVPQTFQSGYQLRLLFDSTHDAHEGDPVHLRGMRVGRITDIRFTDDDPRKGVTMTARINSDVNLPGNTQAYIFTKGFAGGAYLELKPEGEAWTNEKTGQPFDFLPKDDSVAIRGAHHGTELLPEDLKEDLKSALQAVGELREAGGAALADFRKLAQNLNELLGPPPEAPGPPAPATAPAEKGLRATMAKLDRALDGVVAVLGSEENQANIKTSLANLAEAAAKATQAMDALKEFAEQAGQTVKPATDAARRFDEVAKRLIENADKISATMTTIHKAASKVEAGEGTAGRLINDPELYNNLVEATQQMSALMKEFQELVKDWRERGVLIRVK